MKQAGPRHVAREFALRILYSANLLRDLSDETPLPQTRNWWEPDDTVSVTVEAETYARRLVEGVTQSLDTIDRMIQDHARNWRLDRMSIVDRNILRLSIWQLLHDSETPAKVILDEALELAKCYGDEQSYRFVNGILDSLARTLPSRDRTPS